MKNALSILALLIGFYIVETSFFSALFLIVSRVTGLQFFIGHTVDLVLMMLVYLSLNRDYSGTLIWAIVFGIVGNWFGIAWNGAYATGLFAAAGASSLLKKHVLLKDAGTIALFIGAVSSVKSLIHLGMGHFLHQIQSPLRYQAGALFIYVLINALCAPFVFSFLKFFDQWTGVAPTETVPHFCMGYNRVL